MSLTKRFRDELKGMAKVMPPFKKFNYCIFVLIVLLFTVGCGGSENEQTTENRRETVAGGVSSPEDFAQVGLYIDMDESNTNITDKSYEISGDIAIVSFRYTGVKAELRGSCKYDGYELAGIDNNSNGNAMVTDAGGLMATVYTLDPGRVVFWTDGTINYCLHIFVTATDEVVEEILDSVKFENRYSDRADVKSQTDRDSTAFAEKIVKVFTDKDKAALKDMMYYPQELGSGESIANEDEFQALDDGVIFTDILLKALGDENAVDDVRMSEDNSEYIIGTNYKNVHYKLMEDGSFKIVLINN